MNHLKKLSIGTYQIQIGLNSVMNILKKNLEIDGVFLLTIPVHKDSRGFFTESYNNEINEILDTKTIWLQDNESISHKNVFRGLHFQKDSYAQSKLLRVSNGQILDIMIDLRKNSKTFKKYITLKLDSRDKILFIPRGIAHGFLSLIDNTIVNYKCDNLYYPNKESGVNPFKSNLDLNLNLDLKKIKISKKDKDFPSLDDSYIFD